MPACIARLAGALIAACLSFTTVHAANTYPNKPVRLNVPFPAGGPADILARLIGKELAEHWGQPFVIENQPGAGGNIGTSAVASSAPDGYTLLLGFVGTHAINPSLYPTLPFDPIKDFEPVALVSNVTIALVAHPELKVASVSDLVALARQKPGELTFASPGNGTPHHLAGEMFKNMTGTDILHVPYKGAVPALTDLIGGRTSIMFSSVPPALSHIREGKLVALGVTSRERAAIDPSWPTLDESGLPGYEVENWYGVFAPAGTPDAIIQKLNKAINAVMQTPAIQQALELQGAQAVQSTPESFARYVASENIKWAELVKISGAASLY